MDLPPHGVSTRSDLLLVTTFETENQIIFTAAKCDNRHTQNYKKKIHAIVIGTSKYVNIVICIIIPINMSFIAPLRVQNRYYNIKIRGV